MAASDSEAMLEKKEGDLLHRRRAVSEMLYGGRPYEHVTYDADENCFWYGEVAVARMSNGNLAVDDPDGYRLKDVEVPEGPEDETIEAVQEQLDNRLMTWTENL